MIHKDVVTAATGVDFDGYFSFQYPPTFLAVTPALALLPYPAALVAWMAVGLPLYLYTVRLITGTWNTALAATGLAPRALEHRRRPERSS